MSFFALLSINQSLQLSYNWCCSGYANLHACSSWHDTDGSELNSERLSVDGGFRKKFWVSLVSSVPSLRPETFLPPNTACQHLNLICANEVNPQLFSHSRDGAARSHSSILRLRAGLRNTFLWPKTMWLLFSNLIREASWPSSELTQNGGTMWDGSFCPARLSATIWHLDREFVVETLNHHLPPPVCCLHLSAAAADTPIINTLISSHFEWMWSILVFLSPALMYQQQQSIYSHYKGF